MSDDWVHTEGSYREGYDAGRVEPLARVAELRERVAELEAEVTRQSKRLPDFYVEVFKRPFPGDNEARSSGARLVEHALLALKPKARRRKEGNTMNTSDEHAAKQVAIAFDAAREAEQAALRAVWYTRMLAEAADDAKREQR